MRSIGKEIITRNRAGILNSDLVIVNLLGSADASIGSVGEAFWADAYRKPIVIVRDKFHNPHDHLMLNEIATWLCHDLDSAVSIVRRYFRNGREYLRD